MTMRACAPGSAGRVAEASRGDAVVRGAGARTAAHCVRTRGHDRAAASGGAASRGPTSRPRAAAGRERDHRRHPRPRGARQVVLVSTALPMMADMSLQFLRDTGLVGPGGPVQDHNVLFCTQVVAPPSPPLRTPFPGGDAAGTGRVGLRPRLRPYYAFNPNRTVCSLANFRRTGLSSVVPVRGAALGAQGASCSRRFEGVAGTGSLNGGPPLPVGAVIGGYDAGAAVRAKRS